MRRHRHPHGVQERRTTEQLAKAKPGLKKWCRNPKRFRNPRLLKSLRATKRLLKPRLLKPRSLKRRLLKPRLLNAARLPMPPRKSPRCAAAVNGIAAVPRTATAARATIDLRIMLLLLLAYAGFPDALLLQPAAHPSWIGFERVAESSSRRS